MTSLTVLAAVSRGAVDRVERLLGKLDAQRHLTWAGLRERGCGAGGEDAGHAAVLQERTTFHDDSSDTTGGAGEVAHLDKAVPVAGPSGHDERTREFSRLARRARGELARDPPERLDRAARPCRC